nr:cell division control protein 4 [Quercus suber]
MSCNTRRDMDRSMERAGAVVHRSQEAAAGEHGLGCWLEGMIRLPLPNTGKEIALREPLQGEVYRSSWICLVGLKLVAADSRRPLDAEGHWPPSTVHHHARNCTHTRRPRAGLLPVLAGAQLSPPIQQSPHGASDHGGGSFICRCCCTRDGATRRQQYCSTRPPDTVVGRPNPEDIARRGRLTRRWWYHMEPARIHGLGLSTTSQSLLAPDPILSTAPASPTDNMSAKSVDPESVAPAATATTSHMPPPHSTLAQMSFRPATQQTITTVTTTTTVSLPPLILNPPRDLFERDPKQYPLAFSPTPQSIKRFCFDVNGRPTTFHESENAKETVQKYHQLQAMIQRKHGSIRTEEKDEYHTPVREFRSQHLTRRAQGIRASSAPKRNATTPSIAEAAELASLGRRSKKARSQLHSSQSEVSDHLSLNQRAAAGGFASYSTLSPMTPGLEHSIQGQAPSLLAQVGSERRVSSTVQPPRTRLQEMQDFENSEEDERPELERPTVYQDDDSQLGPPLYGRKDIMKQHSFPEESAIGAGQPSGNRSTPPIGQSELSSVPPTRNYLQPRLPNILTNSQQDASLPSPSLSPITAAANAASRVQNAFEASFSEHYEDNVSVMSGLDLDENSKTQSTESQTTSSASKQVAPQDQAWRSGPTVMDIPTMVDAFDSMPEAMQTYIMYQFLRRSAKPTLQMVASVVNPALKCDPFNVLPPELGLNITRFLDFQSMCRAAQVSKRWRRLINSDERAWKDLLERDEFTLPAGEIARAVREGWGWQNPGGHGCEEDLTKQLTPSSPEMMLASEVVSDEDELALSAATSRLKRRVQVKPSSLKRSKRRSTHTVSSNAKPVPTISQWRRLLANAQGPIALANAASHAVPHPSVGLPSLKNMHLFKSLYQRHHLIRKSWMQDDSRPQHLAFRAHHRHVVTCLLFDGDKILTGSDDTKINVYDTKTGALRNRLEGHEGGVWALQYDGDTLVSGSTDRSVRVWDIKTGRNLQTFQGHTSTVRCLVILQPVKIDSEADGTPITMPKEPLIITGSRDSTLRVWKLPKPSDRQIFQTGPPVNDHDNPYFIRTLSGHHNSVRAIAAYGDTLISGSYDCTVRVWKISTGDLVHRLQGHSQKVYSVVLDHTRNRCISGSMDNLVKVWSLESGSCLYNLEGHTSLVGLLDLSANRLVSAAADSTLRIWDPETGQCKSTLSAHTGAITCFQHDGQKVISGSDRTLKMWNVRTGEWVRDLLTDLSGVWQVRFDERRVVAAVQRDNLTYIEVSLLPCFFALSNANADLMYQVLDFGAARDGVDLDQRGRRIVVDCRGKEIEDVTTDPVEHLAAPVNEDAIMD